jgi:uncharacterized membrane protein
VTARAAITVARPREEVERLWESPEHRPRFLADAEAAVTFAEAPGDRGTEIHVDLRRAAPAGRLGEAVRKLAGSEPLAKAKDGLRRFKQQVETGVIARSDAAPGGELAERKLKQRPAQPLDESEREKAGL